MFLLEYFQHHENKYTQSNKTLTSSICTSIILLICLINSDFLSVDNRAYLPMPIFSPILGIFLH